MSQCDNVITALKKQQHSLYFFFSWGAMFQKQQNLCIPKKKKEILQKKEMVS